MKKILIIAIILIFSGMVFCQNRIELKNGSVIKRAKLFSIGNTHIEYEKDGSLHDLLIPKIDKIIFEDTIIIFNEDKRVVYYDKNMKPFNSENISDTIKSGATEIAPDSITRIKPVDTVQTDIKQADHKKDETQTYNHVHDYFILLSPLSLLETDPNLKFSGEFALWKNISISQSLGICFSNPVSVGAMIGNGDLKYGYILETELKLYFSSRKNTNIRYYQAFELMFKNVSYNDMYYHYPEDAETYQTFEFDKTKSVLCANYKIGKLFTFSNFIMDIYVGTGFRLRNIHEYKLKNPSSTLYLTYEDFYRHKTQVPIPSLKAGIKIGFGN